MKIIRTFPLFRAWRQASLVTALWAALSSQPVVAQCPLDDPVTTNNDCSFAVPLQMGITSDLAVQTEVDDYWTYDIPVAQKLTLQALFEWIPGQTFLISVMAEPEACHNFYEFPDNFPWGQQVEIENLSNQPITVTVRVNLIDPPGGCRDYTLVAGLSPATNPCLSTPDDTFEDNDSCATAATPLGSSLSGIVSRTDRDYFSFAIPTGMRLRVHAVNSAGGVKAEMRFLNENCQVIQAQNPSGAGSGSVIELDNITSQPVQVVLEIRPQTFGGFPENCIPYDLSWMLSPAVPSPCSTLTPDTFEPNDTCMTASTLGTVAATNMNMDSFDPDYFRVTIPPATTWNMEVGPTAQDFTFEVFDGADCSTLLAKFDGDYFLGLAPYSLTNVGSVPREIVLGLFMELDLFSGNLSDVSCRNYTLSSSFDPSPCATATDDPEEENDTCATAVVPSSDNLAGLFLSGQDPDFYQYSLDPGQTLHVSIGLDEVDAPVEAKILASDCVSVLARTSFDATGQGDLAYANESSSTESIVLALRLPASELATFPCTTYSLGSFVDQTFQPFCFGDGSGAPCPCNNNSSPGHPGGCANALGDGAILSAMGAPSRVADTFNLTLSSAEPSSFALLVSAVNRLPQTGPCQGCGIAAFDGFRCAGGDFVRHGTRGTDASGSTPNGWGSPDPALGSLILTNGWTPGQTRHFFAFYRSDLSATCGSGRNSSNGVSVAILP